MSEAKKKILAKIKKRQELNKLYKTKAAKRLGLYGIVLQFIEATEKITTEATDLFDFATGLEREAELLHDRIKCIDPKVNIQIMWNKEDTVEDWENLQVEGVRVIWSSFYKKNHPLCEPEKYIDISQLFIEGYISND